MKPIPLPYAPMDLDREIGNYLMEFYLPQPVVLPVPSDNPRFQKLVLLKKLEFQLLKPVSESALELMEQLAEVGVVSDAMRRAYCLVAVDCTLMRVKLRQDATGRNCEFFDVVKRLWRGRIVRVVKSEAEGGLGSEMLREWKGMIETAVWDDSVCDCVLKKFEGVSAVEAVKVYVREEWAKMGASFLELVAEAVKTDQGLQKIMGVDGTPSRRADQTASGNCADPRADQAGSDLRASGSRAGQAASGDRADVAAGGSGGRADVAASGSRAGQAASGGRADVAASRGRADVAAGGSGSRADMAASGSNPRKEMPKPRIKPRDKFVGFRRTRGMLSRKSRGVRIACSEKTAGGPSTCRNYSSPRLAEFNKAREALKLSSLVLRPALKDPLPEALRVAEAILKDAKQDMRHDPAKGSDPMIRVCGPERMHNNMKKRRPVLKWSLLEEVNLWNAVKECGVGNWKLILTAHRDIFLGRTQVDLKDKWRNMTRYS